MPLLLAPLFTPVLGPALAVLGRAALVLVLLVAAGCNDSSSGSVAPAGRTADLEVTNTSHNSITIYIDGDDVGKVPAKDQQGFLVVDGTHKVEARETGHTTRHDLGTYDFTFSNTIKLTYN